MVFLHLYVCIDLLKPANLLDAYDSEQQQINSSFPISDQNNATSKTRENSAESSFVVSRSLRYPKALTLRFIMHTSTSYFTLCLLFLYLTQSIALLHPVYNENLIKGEFYIPNHSPCVRHKTMSVITYSADIYYPSDNFLKIPIITCELYETFTETTT